MKLLALLVLSLASPAPAGALVEHPCPTVPTSIPGEPPVTLVCEHPEFENAKTPSSGGSPLIWVAVPSALALCVAVIVHRRRSDSTP